MTAAKLRVTDLAKRMNVSDKDLIFKLQSLGAEITDSNQVLEPEVIQAIITGKKLAARPRTVILREDRPQPEKKKEAVRPPRPIVKPSPRARPEAPKEEPAVAPPPPQVIIPEFIEAAEAEAAEQERAAREPRPAAPARPKVAAEAPAVPARPAAAAPSASSPAAPAASSPGDLRRPAGPTGPRARSTPGPRPNYQGQQPPYRPSGAPAPRPSGPGQRPSGPSRPAGGATLDGRPRPAGGMRSQGGPGLRPGSPGRMMPPPPAPSPATLPGGGPVRRKKIEEAEERPEKKKTTGKRGKRSTTAEVDAELFTKGPFSGTQIINDDLGPDIVMPEPEEEQSKTPSSSRRDARKQAAPVSAKVLEFKRPTGKVTLSEGVTVKELADKLGVKANDLMKHLLMKKGLMVSINAPLGGDLALDIARELGLEAELVSFEEAIELETMEKTAVTGTSPRGPVITVMGHVDHGKTSLLDAIRETNVAGGEAGGITQHIGAYHVEKRGRKIVFLDTPGHEAFTMMRARGAKVTDIVVLVVAADDGVMPQTREAIDHARAAKVPMVVAINKIDKPNANVDRVRQELSVAGVLVEQWGGDVVSVAVSAKKKQGIDDLLDMILLTSDMLELKANPEQPARAVVLEARKEVGRGIVSTVLVQDGTLRIGDPFFSGATSGKVRAMTDERGGRIKEAGPSTPVQVTGFDDVPNAGDTMQVVDEQTQARMIGQLRQEKVRESMVQKGSRMSLDQLFQRMQTGTAKEINIILKADVQGSVEVLNDTLPKLSTEQVKVNILHSSVGAISTNDVLLASASDAIIVGFSVRPERSAADLAEKEGVDIRLHTVIYNLTDEIKLAMTGMLEPKFQDVFQGRAEVRNTFKVPKAGVIAGCMVIDGVIPRTASARLLRDNRVIFEGKIGSLRHFKNDVSEVRQGFECGIGIERFQDIKIGDVIEAFKVEKLEPVLV
jgi:translation initiation factor IF-2